MRVAIYDIGPVRSVCIFKKKHMLRPGQGVFSGGKMKPQTVQKIIKALTRFVKRCQKMGVEAVDAVATEALRASTNRRAVVLKIAQKTGIQFEIISGMTEAKIIAEGILHFDSPGRKPVALIDVGGGSTEVSLIDNGFRVTSQSLALGAFRMQQMFMPGGHRGTVHSRYRAILKMRAYIQEYLKTHKLGRHQRTVQQAIGSSGTIRALARVLIPDFRNSRAKPQFTLTNLEQMIQLMTILNRRQLALQPGMEKRRMDIILPGAVLLHEILVHLGASQLRTSNYALRDGLLLRLQRRLMN